MVIIPGIGGRVCVGVPLGVVRVKCGVGESESKSCSCSSRSRRVVSRRSMSMMSIVSSASAWAALAQETQPQPETLSNIPQTLSGECVSPTDCTRPKIQRPKSRKAESCTIKCVTTCIRGGDGSPGEGPLNVRR